MVKTLLTYYICKGSSCDNYNGFCDVFHKCRELNALGPLARLANNLFSERTYNLLLKFLHVSTGIHKYIMLIVSS